MTGWPFWHVTITVAGVPVPEETIQRGLEQLSHDHPFLLTGRYTGDRAEIRYWEEGPDARAVARLGLALWEDHRASAGLPEWQVVGLEVLDRDTFRRRGTLPASPVSLVGVAPF